MTKTLLVDPNELRKPGKITFSDIPVNAYQKQVKDEIGNFTKEEFVRIWRDMRYIREFETMLNLVKTTGEYAGVKYSNPGPAHLGIGQEAAYVGEAFCLDVNDWIFGSHRSHGEIIAKNLSSVSQLSDEELESTMKSFLGGKTYAVVDKYSKYSNMKDKAIMFVLYGMLSEVFAKENGYNKGLGGSMHAFFLPFGTYPNNAIVGGSGDISTGAALFKRVNKVPGIVVCNIGDASMGCGPVFEGMNFAAMDQFNSLWDDEHKGGLPIIYNIFNNNYGMGGQTRGETMGYEYPARFGAGICKSQMHAERVDGYNPLAVIDAYRRKKEIIAKEGGPVLLDVLTYRYSGHSPSDADSYRTKEEKDLWMENDSIAAFGRQLIEAKVCTQAELDEIDAKIKDDMLNVMKWASDAEISPRITLEETPDAISGIMFSNEKAKSMDETRAPEVNKPMEEVSRVKAIKNKVRFYLDESGKPVSKNKSYQLRDGIFEAIIQKFYEDPTIVAYGEEHRDWDGAFAVYRGMTEALPYHRYFSAPISEGAIVGSAVGYGMVGGRAVVELMYADFMGRAGDEIFNQLSKWQAMSAGILKMPVVLRMSVGSKYGAQHSQDWTALCTHIPGLKVVFPATPYDAKGLMNAALNGTDPVVFFESQRIYDVAEQFHEGGVPEGYYEIPIGEPDIKKAGSDLTILTIGATLYRVMPAAKELEEKYGISTEVIDARSLVPFNYEKVIESVKKTGKIIVTGDACERGSHMKEFAQTISELCFDYLDAPPVVVGAKNWITPCYEMDHNFFPQPSWILDAVNEKIMPLPGYTPTENYTRLEQIKTNKEGV